MLALVLFISSVCRSILTGASAAAKRVRPYSRLELGVMSLKGLQVKSPYGSLVRVRLMQDAVRMPSDRSLLAH